MPNLALNLISHHYKTVPVHLRLLRNNYSVKIIYLNNTFRKRLSIMGLDSIIQVAPLSAHWFDTFLLRGSTCGKEMLLAKKSLLLYSAPENGSEHLLFTTSPASIFWKYPRPLSVTPWNHSSKPLTENLGISTNTLSGLKLNYKLYLPTLNQSKSRFFLFIAIGKIPAALATRALRKCDSISRHSCSYWHDTLFTKDVAAFFSPLWLLGHDWLREWSFDICLYWHGRPITVSWSFPRQFYAEGSLGSKLFCLAQSLQCCRI